MNPRLLRSQYLGHPPRPQIRHRWHRRLCRRARAADLQGRGKWNTFEIEAKGELITVKFNGTTTVSLRNGKYASGPFALQYGAGVQGATGGPIKWRKVMIQPL